MSRGARFAQHTKVPVERTRQEIEATLKRYGCTAFAFGWQEGGVAMLQFEYRGRAVKFDVKPPKNLRPDSEPFKRAERQRWRILLLWIKAHIEAVEDGIASFEEAFLPWMLLGDGSTVAQSMIPKLPAVKETPKLRAVNP